MFTRTPPPARVPRDRRRVLTFVFGGAVLIYLILTALGTLWTDYLWFDSIGFSTVWTRRWLVGIGLAVAGAVISFLVLWSTLLLAERIGPRFLPGDMAEEEELVVRFRDWSRGRSRMIRVLVAAGLSLFVGLAMSAWRDSVFLYLARQDFGITDPIFGLEAGFYVFQFPLINLALQWLFNLVAIAAVLAAVAHYLNGGIRIRRGSMPTFTRSSKIHLSTLLAILALVRAAMYRMDSLALLYSGRQLPSFFGPGYTDITARLPALRLLMAVAVVTAIVFIFNIWRRGWTLVLVSVGAWVLVSVAALLIYPAIVDRVQVQPQPLAREAEYIANGIDFTRMAYGLNDVQVREFPASSALDAGDIEANRPTIDNLRLWDTAVLPRTYQNLQEIRPYYGLDRVDTDRYIINDKPTQTMIAVRELDEENLGRDDWMNTRLIYTHGIGAVVSQANQVAADGQPVFLLSDLPPETTDEVLDLSQPRVYFGESYEPGRPVIVKTGVNPQEVDLPASGEGIQNSEYDGEAGVDLGSLWRRIAFAFRYRDLNLLISGQIRPDSRVLVERNIRTRLSNVAPFMAVDSDPYPVVADGKVMWVVDMYTTSGHFPYAQPVSTTGRERLSVETHLRPGMNYVANSVKATIDAYDGTVHFYITDESDPIVRAWSEVYPELFTDGAEMPEELADHLRYPQDLFRVQGEMWLNYHVDEPSEFFSRNDAWSIPPDPSSPITRGQIPGSDLLWGDRVTTGGVQYLNGILPYYLLTRLPGEEKLSYVLLQPFNPRDKPNMSSFLVADAPRPDEPSRLIDFRMPQGILVGGTGQIGDRIQQDDEIAGQFTLWGQQGSEVIKGDLLVVPVEESVMYIQPIYLQSTQSGGFPEFRRVVVVFGDQVEWASTLDEAMAKVFDTPVDTTPDPDEPQPPPPDEGVPATVQQLLEQAAGLLDEANSALRAGDLGRYQQLVEEATELIDEARQITESNLSAALP